MWEPTHDETTWHAGRRAGGLEGAKIRCFQAILVQWTPSVPSHRYMREMWHSSFSTSQKLSPTEKRRDASGVCSFEPVQCSSIPRLVMGTTSQLLINFTRIERGESRRRPRFPFPFLLFFVFSSEVRRPFPISRPVYKAYRTTILQSPIPFCCCPPFVPLHGTASHAFTAAHPQRVRPGVIRHSTHLILS
jgi:hypothetical protein